MQKEKWNSKFFYGVSVMQWGKGLMHAREKYGNLQASESSLPSALRIFRAYTTRFQLFPTERAAVMREKNRRAVLSTSKVESIPHRAQKKTTPYWFPLVGIGIETDAADIYIPTSGFSLRYRNLVPLFGIFFFSGTGMNGCRTERNGIRAF